MSYALAGIPWPAYAGLGVAALMLGRQIAVLDIDDGDQCLALFKSNNRVGWVVFAGLLIGLVTVQP